MGDGELVVCCEECEAIWLDPTNLTWEGPSSDEALKGRFQVGDVKILFDEDSGWATADDVRKSIWYRWDGKKSESLTKAN